MYRWIVDLLQPYALAYLATGLAIANLWRKRAGRPRWLALVTVAFLLLTALSMPAVGYLAVGSLEWRYPPLEQRPEDTEAIVVLAGGTRGERELDEDTLRRCLHAAELYRQGRPCPVLVSGGKADPSSQVPACSRLMSDFLVQLGVSKQDLIVEDRSRTTYENAVECRRLLEQHRLAQVVLVTDAVDMYRTVRCFRKQGVAVVPSPCHYRARGWGWSVLGFLPNPNAARGVTRAWHEWLGMGWYWLRGRV
jgi:uncharacterized SAM-binding protein YcdF (DUF218 family)